MEIFTVSQVGNSVMQLKGRLIVQIKQIRHVNLELRRIVA